MKRLNQKLFFISLFLTLGLTLLITASFLIEPEVLEIIPVHQAAIAPIEKIEKNEITIILVGDIMLDRGVKDMIAKYGDGDFKFPFLKIADYLKEANIVFGNLEGTISNKGRKVGSVNSFRFGPKAIEGLTFAGFDILSVANNHALDYTSEALTDTFSKLKEAGIDYVGGGVNATEAGLPIIKEINGSTSSPQTKIAFLAYTNIGVPVWRPGENSPGINVVDEEDIEEIKEKIKAAKQKTDILIVSLHAGNEYTQNLTKFQSDFSKAVIDAGADLVIGHHPHVVQKSEVYKNKYIFYSLGNFIFDQDFSEETMKGLILKVIVEEKKIKDVIPVEIKMNQYYQPEIPSAGKPKSEPQEEVREISSTVVRRFPEDYSSQSVNCIYSVSGVPSPKGVAFTPDGKEFWVTSLMNKVKGVVVFDAKTGEHKKDIRLPDGGGVEIIFNANGSRAFVSQMETGRVFEINTETKKILRTFYTESTWTKVLALSSGKDLIYASNWVGNNVSMIDLESGQLVRNIPTVTTPRGIYVTEDGTTLYVAGFANGEIQKINLETGKNSVLYKSYGAMRHIAADEDREVLYFSDMGKGKIFKVNMENDEVKEFAKTNINPNTIVLTPDKKFLIVSNRGANHPSGQINIPGPEKGTILFFDTSSGERIAALVGGNQPTALDVSPDGRYFIYSNFLDGNLTMCEIVL